MILESLGESHVADILRGIKTRVFKPYILQKSAQTEQLNMQITHQFKHREIPTTALDRMCSDVATGRSEPKKKLSILYKRAAVRHGNLHVESGTSNERNQRNPSPPRTCLYITDGRHRILSYLRSLFRKRAMNSLICRPSYGIRQAQPEEPDTHLSAIHINKPKYFVP